MKNVYPLFTVQLWLLSVTSFPSEKHGLFLINFTIRTGPANSALLLIVYDAESSKTVHFRLELIENPPSELFGRSLSLDDSPNHLVDSGERTRTRLHYYFNYVNPIEIQR